MKRFFFLIIISFLISLSVNGQDTISSKAMEDYGYKKVYDEGLRTSDLEDMMYGSENFVSLSGTVIDVENGEVIPFTNIIISQNNIDKHYAQTKLDGSYKLDRIKKGQYYLSVNCIQCEKIKIEKLVIKDDLIYNIKVKLLEKQ